MQEYIFKMTNNMEIFIIKFSHYERKCYLPIIVNFSDIPKRIEENKILKNLVENLKKANGISQVTFISGGIDTFEELSKVFDTIMGGVDNHKIKYLNFYERTVSDSSLINYDKFNYQQIKYKQVLSIPVKVLEDNSVVEEFGSYPLPIILIE
ncbi:MAG: hypothetical protein ACOYLP_07900 [Flavobacterium sp.]|jgi:hypothetical protein|uniref:hypothetical protein n=1 Tax=Flavobacterium sp. TaxID=239 RepID=UPI003BEB3BC5